MAIMNDIRAALENHLSTTSGVPPVAYENIPFDRSNGTSYLQVSFRPTFRRPAVRGLNPQQLHQGIYSIMVCTPQDKGSGANLDIVDAILTRFEATTDIAYNGYIVSIEYAEPRAGFYDSPFYCATIDVAWYIYS